MIVSIDELAAYMDQPRFSNRQELAAELVLEGLQSELESILRRPVEVGEYTETIYVTEDYLNGRAGFLAMSSDWLPYAAPPLAVAFQHSPVVSITSIRYLPAPVINPVTEWRTLVPGVDYTPRPWGADIYKVAANDTVEITYTGGLDGPAIPHLRLAILRAAAREMANQVDDVVGIKDLQSQPMARAETGFTESERLALRKWKRRQYAKS